MKSSQVVMVCNTISKEYPVAKGDTSLMRHLLCILKAYRSMLFDREGIKLYN
jgi:hypothetical protein